MTNALELAAKLRALANVGWGYDLSPSDRTALKQAAEALIAEEAALQEAAKTLENLTGAVEKLRDPSGILLLAVGPYLDQANTTLSRIKGTTTIGGEHE